MGGNPFPESPHDIYEYNPCGEPWYDGLASIGFIVVLWFAIYAVYKGLHGLYNWYYD